MREIIRGFEGDGDLELALVITILLRNDRYRLGRTLSLWGAVSINTLGVAAVPPEVSLDISEAPVCVGCHTIRS